MRAFKSAVIAVCSTGVLCGPLSLDQSHANDDPPPITIGLTPYLNSALRGDVEEKLMSFVLAEIPRGTSVRILDGYELQEIVDCRIPDDAIYDNPKLRVSRLRNEIARLHRFFSSMHDDDRLDNAIREPQLLKLVGGTVAPGRDRVLVLIGDPRYLDAAEEAFSMRDGFFPSDGHLAASPDRSPFSVAGRDALLEGLRIHHAYLNASWQSDIYAQRVERWWSMYAKRQGGVLVTFMADLAGVLRRALDPSSRPSQDFEPDPLEDKVEMLSMRHVASRSWLQQPAIGRAPAPNSPVGTLKVGIRWECPSCDLDLYSKAGAGELSFRIPRNTSGIHVKDYLTSPTPMGQFEYIEYYGPVDIRNARAWVNFYNGEAPGGATGDVRILFNGLTYSAPFHVAATRGNRGAEAETRSRSSHWIELPLAATVGIGSTARSGVHASEASDAPRRDRGSGARPGVGERTNGDRSARRPNPAVHILSPDDGSTIRAQAGEIRPIQRNVSGDVTGLGVVDAAYHGLRVEISVTTDREYPQGSAKVGSYGRWDVPGVYLGGAVHRINARLIDQNGNVVATSSSSVTVVYP